MVDVVVPSRMKVWVQVLYVGMAQTQSVQNENVPTPLKYFQKYPPTLTVSQTHLQFCIYLYRHSSIFPAELPAVTADCRSHEDFRFHLSYFLFLKNGVFSFSTRFGCPFGDCTPRRIPINDRWILPTVTSLGAIHHVRASWPAALIER